MKTERKPDVVVTATNGEQLKGYYVNNAIVLYRASGELAAVLEDDEDLLDYGSITRKGRLRS